MTDSDRAPAAPVEVDLDKPSAARIYDFLLGGSASYAVDRVFGARAIETFPLIKPLAVGNREWLWRVVRAALDAGITQFLDLGSGLPTAGSVHDLVGRHAGDRGRVVYVDYEPVAASHAQVTLEQDGVESWCGVVARDLRDADAVLSHPETRRLIDFGQPVCLLFVAVLHFVGGADNVPDILHRYRSRLAPGSWLAVSHVTHDEAPPEGVAQIERLRAAYANTQNPVWIRGRSEITGWFDGLEILPPGVVPLPDWHQGTPPEPSPEHDTVRAYSWCAVARKP